LRGYDVAAGKLLATSLRGSYALLAFFPVLATTLLMGGVEGVEFWKTTLALINILFVSLAAGLLASALSRDSQKAMASTLLMLVALCAGGPLLDLLLSSMGRTPFKPVLTLSSPIYVFIAAGAWGRAPFWGGLLVTHLCGWGALAIASILVRRTWQDRPRKAASATSGRENNSSPARQKLRRKLLLKNPVLWLICRERWPSVAMWLFALVTTTGFLLAQTFSATGVRVWSQISWLFGVGLYLWAASQASRLFVETRRGGFLELLLVTPVSVKDAAQAQWRANLRRFAAPLTLWLVVDFFGKWQAFESTWGALASKGGDAVMLSVVTLSAALSAATLGLNLIALFWFGMWMGLRSRNASLAVLKTIAFVQIIPAFVVNFVAGLAVMLITLTQIFRTGAASGQLSGWVALAIPLTMTGVGSVLAMAKDVILIVWARRRLYGCASEQAVLNLRPAHFAPAPAPIAAPMPQPVSAK
jgi:hypothetical protein